MKPRSSRQDEEDAEEGITPNRAAEDLQVAKLREGKAFSAGPEADDLRGGFFGVNEEEDDLFDDDEDDDDEEDRRRGSGSTRASNSVLGIDEDDVDDDDDDIDADDEEDHFNFDDDEDCVRTTRCNDIYIYIKPT